MMLVYRLKGKDGVVREAVGPLEFARVAGELKARFGAKGWTVILGTMEEVEHPPQRTQRAQRTN